MKHAPLDSTREIGILGRLEAECANCGEPIVWADERKEWQSVARKPKEHYVNICATPKQ